MSKRKRNRDAVAARVARAREQEALLNRKHYNTPDRAPFTNVVSKPLVAWCPPDITNGMSTVTARTTNGGREFPRTRASYEHVTTKVRNPVKVTHSDGTTEVVAGSHFNRKNKRTRTTAAAAYVKLQPDVVRLDVGTIGGSYD